MPRLCDVCHSLICLMILLIVVCCPALNRNMARLLHSIGWCSRYFCWLLRALSLLLSRVACDICAGRRSSLISCVFTYSCLSRLWLLCVALGSYDGRGSLLIFCVLSSFLLVVVFLGLACRTVAGANLASFVTMTDPFGSIIASFILTECFVFVVPFKSYLLHAVVSLVGCCICFFYCELLR